MLFTYEIQIVSDFLPQREYYRLGFKVHQSFYKKDLQIEDRFYKRWSSSRSVPHGEHYELEIVFPLSDRLKRFHYEKTIEEPYHIHLSEKTRKCYVSWGDQLASLSEAVTVMRSWSVNAVFTAEHRRLSGMEFLKAEIDLVDLPAVEQYLKEKFKIAFLGSNFETKDGKY
jgi:hypothetical protein